MSNKPAWYRNILDSSSVAIGGLCRNSDGKICRYTRFDGFMSNEDPNMIFLKISLNKFNKEPTRVPDTAIKVQSPSEDWITSFFYDETKQFMPMQTKPPDGVEDFDRYLIEYNGGTDYVVYVKETVPKEVRVYQFPKNYLYDHEETKEMDDYINCFNELVYKFTDFKKVWIGIDDRYGMHGNTIIIQKTDKSYIYVSNEIYNFILEKPLLKYYSFKGNSDVPYPIGITEDEVLFFHDKDRIKKTEIEPLLYLDKNGDKFWGDAYSVYYEHPKLNKIPFDSLEKRINSANINHILIRSIIRPFKERYYMPNGMFEKKGNERFNNLIC